MVQLLTLKLILCQFCNEQYEKPLIYKLVRINSYSKMTVLTRKSVSHLIKCKEFAQEKRALAFNFGQYVSLNDTFDYQINDPFNANCILLMCPEINNFTALARVTGFNYYSVYYENVWVEGNRTLSCLPTAGLFIIASDKLNYTDARNSCQNLNGSLAHIASEIRTNYLATIIGNYTSVYVGLSSKKEERVWKNECNEPLSCFSYRAWGEGQPSRSHGCTTLTRSDVKSIPFWQVVPCTKELQYICEIYPPYYHSNATNSTDMPNCRSEITGQLWKNSINSPANLKLNKHRNI